jgi:hypothetical protein
MDERERLSERECEVALEMLFPAGFAAGDIRAEVAPEGWERSPLLRVFHPTAEQVLEETLAIHRNIASLRKESGGTTSAREPELTLEDVRSEMREEPVEADRELAELVGLCVWDIFSSNHDVIAPDGRRVYLGSWRSAGELIADLMNRRLETARYGYLDFYMGTSLVSRRADLKPVYAMVFRRLLAHGYGWEYSFPRIHLVDMRPLRDAMDAEKGRPEWEDYSPEDALAKEAEEQKRDAEIERMREELDESYRQAAQEARKDPPPDTVEAYRAVYGRFPKGWPP